MVSFIYVNLRLLHIRVPNAEQERDILSEFCVYKYVMQRATWSAPMVGQ